MKDFKIWSLAEAKLSKGIPVILLIVASHKGSSPGKTRFKMIISADKDQIGSIGGGIMELNMIKLANETLVKRNIGIQKHIQEHNKKAPKDQQSGLICSGTQTNLLIYLNPKIHLSLISSALEYYKSSKFGYLKVNENEFTIENEIKGEVGLNNSDVWEYIERVGDPYTVHMFGGGHVGYAITRVLSNLDFYIRLYDNRESLEMIKTNQYAHEKIIGKYSEIADLVQNNKKSFVVIATFSMDFDAEVFEKIISKELGFIGLMGSKTKIKKIFNRMRKYGIRENLLKQVQAPIGIPINDETAEEIAVSIAAQLIKHKNS